MYRTAQPCMARVFLEALVPVELNIDHWGFNWRWYCAHLAVLHTKVG